MTDAEYMECLMVSLEPASVTIDEEVITRVLEVWADTPLERGSGTYWRELARIALQVGRRPL